MQGSERCSKCGNLLKTASFYYATPELKLCQWHYLERLGRQEQSAVDASKRPYANATKHSRSPTAPSVVYAIGD